METKNERIFCLISKTAEFYAERFSAERAASFAEALSHLKIEDIELAIKRHKLDPRFGRKMFYPADIIKQLEKGGVNADCGSGVRCATVSQRGEYDDSAEIYAPKCIANGCQRPATLSSSITETNAWFCRDHFDTGG